jgi:hypothetical protein
MSEAGSQIINSNASAVLDTWVNHTWREGVQLSTLPDFTKIVVETRNSTYEITTIDGVEREIVIRGGKFFPEGTAARLCGSSLRSSFLKLGGIYAGFNMEILWDGQTIVTSPVRSIRVYRPTS